MIKGIFFQPKSTPLKMKTKMYVGESMKAAASILGVVRQEANPSWKHLANFGEESSGIQWALVCGTTI